MQTAEFRIEKLQLAPHPEGGFYRETEWSRETCTAFLFVRGNYIAITFDTALLHNDNIFFCN